MKEILTIHIHMEETISIHGNTSDVTAIHFTGYAEGDYFNGTVLPHGIDFQKIKPGSSPELSARYLLEGTDCDGKPCRIAIENNGSSDENGVVRTKPFLVTDSRALAWMETAELTGTITNEDGLVIHILDIR